MSSKQVPVETASLRDGTARQRDQREVRISIVARLKGIDRLDSFPYSGEFYLNFCSENFRQKIVDKNEPPYEIQNREAASSLAANLEKLLSIILIYHRCQNQSLTEIHSAKSHALNNQRTLIDYFIDSITRGRIS